MASLDAMRFADTTLLVAIAAIEIPKTLPNPIRVIRKELDLYANIRPLKDYARFAPKGRKVDSSWYEKIQRLSIAASNIPLVRMQPVPLG